MDDMSMVMTSPLKERQALTEQTAGMLSNREYARFFWYAVSGVIGVYAVANIFRHLTCKARYAHTSAGY